MNILEARCAGRVRLLAMLLALAAGGHALAEAPCDGPQRLCASVDANTSAHSSSRSVSFTRTAATQLAAPLLALADPARLQANEPSPPPSPSSAPIRIALLLPLRSATLATAAEAVRAGFLAGMDRDGTGFKADFVPTGDAPRDVRDA